MCASLARALGEWDDSLATVAAGSTTVAAPGAVIALFEPSAVVWLAGIQLPLPACRDRTQDAARAGLRRGRSGGVSRTRSTEGSGALPRRGRAGRRGMAPGSRDAARALPAPRRARRRGARRIRTAGDIRRSAGRRLARRADRATRARGDSRSRRQSRCRAARSRSARGRSRRGPLSHRPRHLRILPRISEVLPPRIQAALERLSLAEALAAAWDAAARNGQTAPARPRARRSNGFRRRQASGTRRSAGARGPGQRARGPRRSSRPPPSTRRPRS